MVEKLGQQRTNALRKKTFLVGVAILLSAHLSAEVSISANLFLGRAFSANISRELLMTGPLNQNTCSDINGFFSMEAAYQRAWEQSETQGIGAYPFWSEINSMTIGDNSGNYNVDAYQFDLGPITPTTTKIALDPVIYQAGSDFMFYVRSQPYGHSVFAKIKSALSSMVVNPGFTETNPATPVVYPAGALSVSAFTNVDPSTSMAQAFAGITGTQSVQGDFRPMTNGLINGIQSTGAHLSDTEMTIGYNYTCSQTDNSASLGLRVTAPTGNKPQGVYVLEPINGRGGNWGVGFYLAGDYRLWHNASENTLKLSFMSSGIHLCTANVIRSYDLTSNGTGSKYLLVADYNNGAYQNSIQNLINLSTLESQSSFAFEGDAALALSYNADGFSVDLGYNVWGRTGEDLTISQNFQAGRYAILGRQQVSNSDGTTSTGGQLCQPTATMSNSLGYAGDNATWTATLPLATDSANCIGGNSVFNTVYTAQYQAVTSKLFTKIGYNWKDSDCCPYLSLVGDVEWSNISNNALPQWSLALVGGVSL